MHSIKLVNFENPEDVLKEANPDNDEAISIILRFYHSQTGNLNLLGLPFILNGLHFDQEGGHL